MPVFFIGVVSFQTHATNAKKHSEAVFFTSEFTQNFKGFNSRCAAEVVC